MKGENRKGLPGWMADRDASIQRRKDKHGGALECDIEEYNRRLREKSEEAKRACEARRRADEINFERACRAQLKEVWE